MRLALAALIVLAAARAAAAQAPPDLPPQMDGPVAGGAFGMGGADYYGEVRDGPVSATRRAAISAPKARRAVRTRPHSTVPGRRPVR